MLRLIDLYINRFAQDRINLEELLSWFSTLSNQEKREVIMTTATFLEQAHPDLETIEQGIKAIPMKPTVTPIVLLKTHSLKIAIAKILLLPERELEKSFLSLVSLFRIADTERRNKWCKDGCTHEWHNLDKSYSGRAE